MIDMHSSAPPVQVAYDRIASDYDRQVEGDAWIRERLWQRYVTLFRPGDKVLDVSCGTGIDAAFLALSGISVTAIDISPEMIARCRERAVDGEIGHLINTLVLDYAEIQRLPHASFDGIISAFAGLNTSPDLACFARDAAELLRPNGRLIVHMLNQLSLWEWLSLVAHGRWREASALGRMTQRTFNIGRLPIIHTLYFPLAAYQQAFATDFVLERGYALGVLRPPHTMRRIPKPLVRTLSLLETRLGKHRPWINLGRFFVLELVKRSPDEPSA